MEDICEVCGNERAEGSLWCTFCGNKHEASSFQTKKSRKHRIVNLEIGRPIVDEAMDKLQRELASARSEGIAVVTIIHGYGSSGRGGKIGRECRRVLDYLQAKRQIRQAIPGEIFSKKNGQTKSLLQRIPGLEKNGNLNRGNRGVTIVEI